MTLSTFHLFPHICSHPTAVDFKTRSLIRCLDLNSISDVCICVSEITAMLTPPTPPSPPFLPWRLLTTDPSQLREEDLPGDLQSLSWLTSVDVPRLQQMADSRGHSNGPAQGSLLEQQTGEAAARHSKTTSALWLVWSQVQKTGSPIRHKFRLTAIHTHTRDYYHSSNWIPTEESNLMSCALLNQITRLSSQLRWAAWPCQGPRAPCSTCRATCSTALWESAS